MMKLVFIILITVTCASCVIAYPLYATGTISLKNNTKYFIDDELFHSCSEISMNYYPHVIGTDCTFIVKGVINGEPSPQICKDEHKKCVLELDALGFKNIFQYIVSSTCKANIKYRLYSCNSKIDAEKEKEEMREYIESWKPIMSFVVDKTIFFIQFISFSILGYLAYSQNWIKIEL